MVLCYVPDWAFQIMLQGKIPCVRAHACLCVCICVHSHGAQKLMQAKGGNCPFVLLNCKLAPVCRWFINRGQCWEENGNSIYWQCHLVLSGLSFLVLFCCVLFPKIPGLNAAFQVEANLMIHDWPATEKLRTNSPLSVLPYGTESLQECVCYG